MSMVAPGTCRHCGCHGESCSTPDGEKCCWTDRMRTVCSAPGCQRAEAARVAAARTARIAAAPKRLNSADIHKLIMRRGRRRKAQAA